MSSPTLETIAVTTSDGAGFVVRVLPQEDPGAPVVLVLPAMAMKAKFYTPLAKALHGSGLSVATVDLRAQGESTPPLAESPNFGYRELVEVDLPAVTRAVRERFPTAPIVLFGHSLGGQLSLLHASGSGDIAAVVVIGTGTVYWKAFGPRRWWESVGVIQYIGVVARLRGRWPGGVLIPGAMQGRVMTDWARHSRTGRYRPHGSTVDYDRRLRETDIPVLVISLDQDTLGPKSTVDFLCRRIPNAELTRWHVTESDGVAHRDHIQWIKDSSVIGPKVAAWITERTAP